MRLIEASMDIFQEKCLLLKRHKQKNAHQINTLEILNYSFIIISKHFHRALCARCGVFSYFYHKGMVLFVFYFKLKKNHHFIYRALSTLRNTFLSRCSLFALDIYRKRYYTYFFNTTYNYNVIVFFQISQKGGKNFNFRLFSSILDVYKKKY